MFDFPRRWTGFSASVGSAGCISPVERGENRCSGRQVLARPGPRFPPCRDFTFRTASKAPRVPACTGEHRLFRWVVRKCISTRSGNVDRLCAAVSLKGRKIDNYDWLRLPARIFIFRWFFFSEIECYVPWPQKWEWLINELSLFRTIKERSES